MGAIAEIWAEIELRMTKAGKGAKDVDGLLPDGRTLQVKAKVHGAHGDAETYITMREGHTADAVLVVFIDQTGRVRRTVGPVEVAALRRRGRRGRCYVSEMPRPSDRCGITAGPEPDPGAARREAGA